MADVAAVSAAVWDIENRFEDTTSSGRRSCRRVEESTDVDPQPDLLLSWSMAVFSAVSWSDVPGPEVLSP
jgi:hypothetical protein